MKTIVVLLLLLISAQGLAREAPDAADDPALQKRVVQLTSELRCLVCQNQSLADSHADLAVDLRNQVRSQMQAGRSDAEIRDYMVARYGDFVLYDPPLKARTILLWAGPFALLLVAFLGLAAYLRDRRRHVPEVRLTSAERERAEALLRGESGEQPQ